MSPRQIERHEHRNQQRRDVNRALRCVTIAFGILPAMVLALGAGACLHLGRSAPFAVAWSIAGLAGFAGLCAFVMRPQLTRFSTRAGSAYISLFAFGIVAAAPLLPAVWASGEKIWLFVVLSPVLTAAVLIGVVIASIADRSQSMHEDCSTSERRS
jgi:hypothetical protein